MHLAPVPTLASPIWARIGPDRRSFASRVGPFACLPQTYPLYVEARFLRIREFGRSDQNVDGVDARAKCIGRSQVIVIRIDASAPLARDLAQHAEPLQQLHRLARGRRCQGQQSRCAANSDDGLGR